MRVVAGPAQKLLPAASLARPSRAMADDKRECDRERTFRDHRVFRNLMPGKKVCFLRVGNRRPCAFTSARARRGARKFDGECALTRSAYGDGDDSDGAIL